MSNGDKDNLHVVARKAVLWDGSDAFVLCMTDQGNPGVYNDAGHAEAHACKVRDTHADGVRVLNCPVL